MPETPSPATNALLLSLTCFVAVAGIYAVKHFLEDKITVNKNQAALDMVEELLPLAYDNDPLADTIAVTLSARGGAGDDVNAYRARLDGEPVGLVFSPVKASGYNGIMEIGMGIKYDGSITGVRILRHRETPGLGDNISQDNSDWIFSFNGRSLANTPKGHWAAIKDGGDFDQLSGATISSRAVIKAVEYALNYYETNRESLF